MPEPTPEHTLHSVDNAPDEDIPWDIPLSALAPAFPDDEALHDLQMPYELFAASDVSFIYTRAQALANGTLVDVSKTAPEVGFPFPVAVTAALWADIETIPEPYAGYETPEGRLWEVLSKANAAIRQNKGGGSEMIYPCILHTADTPDEQEYRVKLVCGPGDEDEPVITLMLPQED